MLNFSELASEDDTFQQKIRIEFMSDKNFCELIYKDKRRTTLPGLFLNFKR